MKSFVRFSRIRKPSAWLVLSTMSDPGILILNKSKCLSFFYDYHIRILRLYIRKILKKRFRKPIFQLRPYLFLSKKGKAVRMGKGKGNLSDKFFPAQFGHCLMRFPLFESFVLSRLFRSLRLRLPFRSFVLNLSQW